VPSGCGAGADGGDVMMWFDKIGYTVPAPSATHGHGHGHGHARKPTCLRPGRTRRMTDVTLAAVLLWGGRVVVRGLCRVVRGGQGVGR
jgi:hypothetical protein